MRGAKWALVGVVVCLLIAASVFMTTPHRTILDDPDCAGTLPLTSTIEGAPTQLVPGDALKVSSGGARLVRVGTSKGLDAAEIDTDVAGEPVECVLVVGQVYRLGSGRVRVESIQPTTPWQDITTRAQDYAVVRIAEGD